jgi:very-short-patch-repair endonuclease/predicted transcriptional regulator of viral defense system
VMGQLTVQSSAIWALARRQHGVVARWQLMELGLTADAIQHRIARGRLHPVYRGVYAVGRPQLTRRGHWMAAVLACGPGCALSHDSCGALLGISTERSGLIHVSVPGERRPRHAGIVPHRRSPMPEVDHVDGIPVTDPVTTLIDLATSLSRDALESAINAADRRDLIDPERLRDAVNRRNRTPGVAILRKTLDRRTFTLTDSELERRFRPIGRNAGLPPPETQVQVNGYRVDFYWPDLGLVVETDGLRYHRTAAQQTVDRERDQAHAAAGLVPLRFTHAQIRYEPARVERTLATVAARIRDDRSLD